MKRTFLIILLSLLLLTGCMTLPEEETTVFIPPTEEPTIPTTEPTTSEEKPTYPFWQEEYSPERLFALHSYGAGSDEFGSFFYFSQFGGDYMDLSLRERFSQNGVTQAGVLLFVDGYPQPYSTSKNEDIRYLHTSTILWSEDHDTLIFTPIRGKQGEMPELVWFNINEPNSFPTSIEEALAHHTSGSKGSTSRILLCADPEPMPLPPSNYAITNSVCTTEPMENDGNVDWTFTVNGENNVFLDGITAETPLELRAECWGMEGAEFTVVVFVDNKPVEGIWEVTLQNGEKTCLTGELLLPDFDGSAVIYAVLVPRNTTDPKFNYINFYPMASQTFYLVDELP